MAAALLQRRGGRGAAPRDEPQAQRGGDRGVPAPLRRGLPRQRDRRADGARDLRQARRLLGLRLPEVARRRVRPARLPVGLAAPLLPGRVPLLAPERPADGLLPALLARPRRAAPRRRGAPAAREPQRGRDCTVEEGAVADRPRLRPLGSARPRRRRSPPTSRTPTSATSPAAPSPAPTRSRRSSPPAPATSGGRGASSSGASA